MWGKAGAKIGFVAAGKNWLDLIHAMSLLNIDEAEAERLGISLYKIGQTFPLDMVSLSRMGRWAGPDCGGRGKAQADRNPDQGSTV